MIIPTEIKELAEKAAELGVGHAPTANPPVIRFYGYNNDEAIGGELAETAYPRMGMSLRTHNGLFGNYIQQQSALGDNLTVEVCFIDKIDNGDFADEYAVYDSMKLIMDEFVLWCKYAISTGLSCDFPALERMDFSSITYRRVGPVHTSAFGWALMIPVKDSILYDGTNNRFKDMTA